MVQKWSGLLLTVFLLSVINLAQERLTKEPRPKWVNEVMPGYFVGISTRRLSEAEARDEALQNARRQIIESLGAVVESEIIDSLVEKGDKFKAKDDFTRSTVKVIAKNIIAVTPEKYFVEEYRERIDGKRTTTYQAFVRVFFDQANYRATIEELVNEVIGNAQVSFDQAKSLALSGQLYAALEMAGLIEKSMQKYLELTGLPTAQLSQLQSMTQLAHNFNGSLINSIQMEIFGDKQLAKWGSPLAQPLGAHLFYRVEDKTVDMADVVVQFTAEPNLAVYNKEARTDLKGCAYCYVNQINTPKSLVFEVKPILPNTWNFPNLTRKVTIFSDNKAIVRIIENNLGQVITPSSCEASLEAKLTSYGFKVIRNNPFSKFTQAQVESLHEAESFNLAKNSGADLLVIGYLVAEQPSKVQDNFYFTRSRGIIHVYNVSKMVVVGTFQQEGKEAGNSPENAGSKAIKKIYQQLEKNLINTLGLE